jgi:excisionase family DNA binding protein
VNSPVNGDATKPGPLSFTASAKPLLATIPEAAWELRLQRRFLDRAIEDGLVEVARFGRAIRIHRNEIERLAKEGLPSTTGSAPKRAKSMKSI